jgi:hypothetical protein
MTRAQMRQKSIRAIQSRGCLLVYPLDNRPEPRSLWSELFPRSKMRWEWDSGGDNRVADLWYLKEELSRSREVIYSKWFQGRATFFSFEVFIHLLAFLRAREMAERVQGESRDALDYLQNDSPLSTKQLKAALELEGRLLEPTYNRALKPLWQNGLIVAFGEFEDSSFPSLGIGATTTLFEDLWNESADLDPDTAGDYLLQTLGERNPFYKFALKVRRLSSPS